MIPGERVASLDLATTHRPRPRRWWEVARLDPRAEGKGCRAAGSTTGKTALRCRDAVAGTALHGWASEAVMPSSAPRGRIGGRGA